MIRSLLRHLACLREAPLHALRGAARGLTRLSPRLQRFSAHVEAGWNAYRAGDHRAAELGFLAAEAILPGTLQVLEGCAWSRLGRGDHSEAIVRFGEILRRVPQHPGALRGRARARRLQCEPLARAWRLVHEGRPDVAVDCFASLAQDRRRDLSPGERWRVFEGWAFALTQLGRPTEAVAVWQRLLQGRPGQPQALAGLGRCFFQLHRFDEARRYLREALEKLPEAQDLRSLLAWCDYHELKYPEALAGFDLVMVKQPLLADAHFGRGWCLLRMQQKSLAWGAFRGALELSSQHPSLDDLITHLESGGGEEEHRLLLEVGCACYREADYERGRTIAATLLGRHPATRAQAFLGACLHALGAYAEAHATLEQVPEDSRDEIRLRTWIPAAPGGSRRLVENSVRSMLGWTQLAQGLGAEAREHFEAALKRAPRAAHLWTGLGLCASALGHHGEARRHLGRALELDARDEDARAGLRHIDEQQWGPFYSVACEGRPLAEVRGEIQRVLAALPAGTEREELAEACAWLHLENGDAGGCLEILARYTGAEPGDATRFLTLQARVAGGHLAEFQAVWARLPGSVRKSPRLLLLETRALMLQGHERRALRLARRGTRRLPEHSDLWAERGRIERMRGWNRRSRRSLGRALRLVPDHPGALEEMRHLRVSEN